ncbi:hypothetical protein C8R45DRAFT_1175906 [Mycena sanguinolenta]|nr:hypothetical protein C8R45DRAFT_1175906 [Mycena sanguinolenta]
MESTENPRWLPNEILEQIMEHSATATQATLSRVSRLFHDLCVPVLHRVVEIKDSNSVASFYAVRSFTVDMLLGETNPRGNLLLASLKLMLRLDHLFLSESASDDEERSILLREHIFPQLLSCDIWTPWNSDCELVSDLVAAFLARHSTLKRVYIHPCDRIPASQSIRVCLPDLEFYGGEAEFILGIDAVHLKEVQLIWSEDDTKRPHKKIVASVAKHMPRTKILRLQYSLLIQVTFHFPTRSSLAAPQLVAQDKIRPITECLPRLTGLVYLAMEQMGTSTSGADPNVDRIAVEGWGEACPTLEACCLNNSGWRKVDGRWELCPIKEFWTLAGLSKMLVGY